MRLNTTVAGYAGRFTLFSDFWDALAYDPALRAGQTEWLIKNRDKHHASHLLFPPKTMIAMGVTVSAAMQAAAEGPTVPHTNYSNRADFERVVAQHGLPKNRPLPR